MAGLIENITNSGQLRLGLGLSLVISGYWKKIGTKKNGFPLPIDNGITTQIASILMMDNRQNRLVHERT